jgi:predicted transcriptional regulator
VLGLSGAHSPWSNGGAARGCITEDAKWGHVKQWPLAAVRAHLKEELRDQARSSSARSSALLHPTETSVAEGLSSDAASKAVIHSVRFGQLEDAMGRCSAILSACATVHRPP